MRKLTDMNFYVAEISRRAIAAMNAENTSSRRIGLADLGSTASCCCYGTKPEIRCGMVRPRYASVSPAQRSRRYGKGGAPKQSWTVTWMRTRSASWCSLFPSSRKTQTKLTDDGHRTWRVRRAAVCIPPNSPWRRRMTWFSNDTLPPTPRANNLAPPDASGTDEATPLSRALAVHTLDVLCALTFGARDS